MYKKLLMIFILVVFILTLCGTVGCTPQADVNTPNDDANKSTQNVINASYDVNFISLDSAKALFAPSFNPLLPDYQFLDNAKYQRELQSGLLVDPLLATPYNYYLSLNNPDKQHLSEAHIYQAYSLTISTPSILKNPAFFGLSETDVTGFANESVWFDYDYYNAKYGNIAEESLIKTCVEAWYFYNFNTKDNEMPFYGVEDSTARVSWVTFNAYSDTIKSDYLNNYYPRNKKITDSKGTKGVTNLTFEHNGILVDLYLSESKVVRNIELEDADRTGLYQIQTDENNTIIEDGFTHLSTLCTANFRLDDINYSITYPLMNRDMLTSHDDYGLETSTDFPKLKQTALKSMAYFIDKLAKQ